VIEEVILDMVIGISVAMAASTIREFIPTSFYSTSYYLLQLATTFGFTTNTSTSICKVVMRPYILS